MKKTLEKIIEDTLEETISFLLHKIEESFRPENEKEMAVCMSAVSTSLTALSIKGYRLFFENEKEYDESLILQNHIDSIKRILDRPEVKNYT